MVGSASAPITPMAFSANPAGAGAADNVSTYLNPYVSNVVNATQAQFNNANAQQQQGLAGQAINAGAWGGDRVGVAQAELANQQQLAQAPVLAGLYNTGYGQALGEFNTQQQAGIGAQEASGWLGENAAFALGSLGQEAQSTALTGASANLQAGGLQQQLAQEQLNIPYEYFQQQQAYPFQTTNWLAGITEGIGGNSGGTSTTTSPGPSTASQIGGLGLAGLGILGETGAFGSSGWLAPAVASIFAKRGGRISPLRHYDMGGALPALPDLTSSYVPSSNVGGQGGNNIPKAPAAATDNSMAGAQNLITQANLISKILRNRNTPSWTESGPADPGVSGLPFYSPGSMDSSSSGFNNYARGGRLPHMASGGTSPMISGFTMSPGRNIAIPQLTNPSSGMAIDPNTGKVDTLPMATYSPFPTNSTAFGRPNYATLPGMPTPITTNFVGGRPVSGTLGSTPGGNNVAATNMAGAGGVGGAVSGNTGQGGGGQNGIGSAGDAAGQPGSAGTGFAKSAADFGTSLIGGQLAPGFGAIKAGVQLATDPSYSLSNALNSLTMGILGSSPSNEFGSPSYGVIQNSAINPSAYGLSMDSGEEAGPGLGSGTQGTGGGAFGTQTGENAGAKAAATGTDASGLASGSDPNGDLGSNPGISGSTGFSGSASTSATGDTTGDVGNTGGGSGGGSGDGGGGGDACFDAATPITMADGTTKRISEIRPGDLVRAFDEDTWTFQPGRVVAITTNGHSRRAMSVNGTIVTSEHPFFDGTWVRAKNLVPGTFVFGDPVDGKGLGGRIREINSVVHDAGVREVYNFQVEPWHTYIAGGFIVHNSKARGGTVHHLWGRRQFDFGGNVGADISQTGAIASGQPPGGGNPLYGQMYQQFSQLPMEKLQELSVRLPPSSTQGMLIRRALMQKQMNPTQAAQTNPAQAAPMAPMAGAGVPQQVQAPGAPLTPGTQPQQPGVGPQPQSMMAGGGRLGYDDGGTVSDMLSGAYDAARNWYNTPGSAADLAAANSSDRARPVGPPPGIVPASAPMPHRNTIPQAPGQPTPTLTGNTPTDFNPSAGMMAGATSSDMARGLTPQPAAEPGPAGGNTAPDNRPNSRIASSPWAALIAAGFGTMAGKSPHALENIGQGGLTGMKYLETQQAEETKEQQIADEKAWRQAETEARSRGYDLEAKKLDVLLQQHKDTLSLATEKMKNEQIYREAELKDAAARLGIEQQRANAENVQGVPSIRPDPNDPTKNQYGMLYYDRKHLDKPPVFMEGATGTSAEASMLRAQAAQQNAETNSKKAEIAKTKGTTATEWRYNTWLSAYPGDTKGALDYAGGHRQMSDQDMMRSAYNVVAKDPSVAGDQAAMDARAKQIFANMKSGVIATPDAPPPEPGFFERVFGGSSQAQPAAAPAAQPKAAAQPQAAAAQPQAAPQRPAWVPEGAKQAPDKNWYIPDPNRQGKYLMVQPPQ